MQAIAVSYVILAERAGDRNAKGPKF